MNFLQLFPKRKTTVTTLFLCFVVFLQTNVANAIHLEDDNLAFEAFQEDLADYYTYSMNGTGSVLIKVVKSGNSLTLSVGQEDGFKTHSGSKFVAQKRFMGSYTYKSNLKGYLSNYEIDGKKVILIKENLYLYAYEYNASTYRPGTAPRANQLGDMYPHESATANDVPSNIGDLTGSYRFVLAKSANALSRKGFAAGFDISTVGNQIVLELNDLEGEASDVLSGEQEIIMATHNSRVDDAKNNLSRTFIYDSTIGAFTATLEIGVHFIQLYPMTSGDIAVRYITSQGDRGLEYGILKKNKGSLFDIVNSDKADVSAITGSNWKIEGSSIKLSITTAVKNDLNIRVNGEIFRLDKNSGGTFESYYGTNDTDDEITLDVINNNKIRMSLGESTKILSRNGGVGSVRSAQTTTTTSSSSNGAVGQLASAGTAGPMDQILFQAVASSSTTDIDTALGEGANINSGNASGNTPLHQAVLKGDDGIVDHLINANADINRSNKQGRSPLDLAIQKSTSTDATLALQLLDNNASVSGYAIDQAILKKNDELLDKVIANGDKKMITNKAVEKGDRALVEKMIGDYGVFITKDMFANALKYRKYPVAELMVENGYNANDAVEESIKAGATDIVFTAVEAGGNATKGLTYGIQKNDTQLIDLAISKGADTNQGLQIAIEKNSLPLITKMLDKGAAPDSHIEKVAGEGKDNILALLLENGGDASKGVVAAVNARKTKTLALLLENGADANLGILPAAQKDNVTMVDMLIEAGANGEPLMAVAIEKNNTKMVASALKGGAEATKPDYIKTASAKGSDSIVTLLLEAGADPNEGMQEAVANNKETVLKLLIDGGADGSNGELLALSTKHNSTTLSKMLLDAGALPQDGIKGAVTNTAHLVLQQLIDAGGEANDQSYLTTVVVKNSTASAKILLNQGLSAQGKDSSGLTYVHHSAKNNNSGLMDLLLKNGAEADAVANGDTPLHLAVRNRNAVSVVQLLIDAGADVNARNAKGKTALKLNKGNKTKRLLKENGAVKK